VSSAGEPARAGTLVRVRDLSVAFAGEGGDVVAVEGVSFDIPRRSTVALVGESGSGKSVTAQALLGILPSPPARVRGVVEMEGRDLLQLPERELRKIRGARIGMVFQDPTAALDPLFKVGAHVVEAITIHERVKRRDARRRALELLARVGLPEPEERFDCYPHELSGGMRQRVMIAVALACAPALLVADEPTASLDMLGAAGIVTLLGDVRRESDMSLLLISHDVSLVAEVADRLVVLYAGLVVEEGPTREILAAPRHPYTRALLASLPPLRTRPRRRRPTPTRLPAIAGHAPPAGLVPSGCRFAERCPEALERCAREAPPILARAADPVRARCWLHEERPAEGAPP
jgi:peptide/nickel transport system ATP-binding protein